jgi:hypothetical protein
MESSFGMVGVLRGTGVLLSVEKEKKETAGRRMKMGEIPKKNP